MSRLGCLAMVERTIGFMPVLVDLTGSITGALMLSQAAYWQVRCQSKDGWWYKTHEDWMDETRMTRRELETARKGCAKFLRYELRGVPARGWYCVNEDALTKALLTVLGGVQTRLAESAKLDWRKAPNLDGGKRQCISTEITTESTPKNTNKSECIEDAPKQLVHRFRSEFPETYCVSAPKQVREELQAGAQMLAAGETIDGLVKLAQLNSKADFAPFRGQSATLVRLQQNLACIKARLNGALKSAVSDGRQRPERLELRRIAI